MVTRIRAKKKFVEVPRLCQDGENWLEYCEKPSQAAAAQDLLGLLNGTNMKPNEPWDLQCTATWMCDDTEAQYLIVMTTPSIIHD
jgi:hypothetical protein